MKKLCTLFLASIIIGGLTAQSCLPEGISFETQAQIDSFPLDYPNCTEIEGDVIINGEEISNLNGLNVLVYIAGSLRIHGNDLLANLTGLDGLDSIGGSLIISANGSLTNLNGLEGLSSIGGSLVIGNYQGGIYPNISLNSLNGLEALTSIGGSLSIDNNDALTNLIGLEGLTSLGNGPYSGLYITGNNSLNNLAGIENLHFINGNLHFYHNWSLSSFTGLDGLDSISGGLFMAGNTLLTGFAGLEGLVSIGNYFTIGHSLYGNGNQSLKNFTALESLDTIGGDLTIVYNDSLSVCDAPFICEYLSDPSGHVVIHNNAPGCNSYLKLAYDCGITYPCLVDSIYNFYSQGDLDYFPMVFPGCTDLTSDVVIRGYDITNLDSLYMISSIDGDLSIYETYLSNFTGLENLSFISGNFDISIVNGWGDCVGNAVLTSFIGMEGLYSIGGSLGLNCNRALATFNGLEGLHSVGGNLEIAGNDSLNDLTGLDGLNSVGGNLVIGGNYYWGSGGLYSLNSLAGLGNLNMIGGDLGISGNPSLLNVMGMEGLTTISGSLTIIQNEALTNLSAFESLISVGGDLWILNNDLLSNCEANIICNYLSDPTGSVNIYNNGTGCSNPAEIADGCGFSISCLPYGNYYFTSQEDIDHFQDDYPDCVDLNGNVEIGGDNINDLTGLNNVNSASGTLRIHHNNNLTNLSGLENMVSIGNSLTLWDNDALMNINDLAGLTSIGGDLRIDDNDLLNELTGLDNISPGSIEKLFIIDNSNLSECAVQSVCDFLAAGGWKLIYGNASGCLDYYEVVQACETISIGEVIIQNSGLEFICYPNPAFSTFIIAMSSIQPQTTSLTIYGIQGQSLISQPITEQHTEIDITHLPAGIYIIKVWNDKDVMVQKVVKR